METPLRLGVLIGHSLAAPLPEAVETAREAVNVLARGGLRLDVWVDAASADTLRRLADRGCDLLLYYGHGTEDGRLLFADGARTYKQLSSGLGLERFWEGLEGVSLFACHSGKFAADLPCPWLAFTEEILRLAPHGFMHAWTRALKMLPLDQSLRRAHDECGKAMSSSFPDCLEFSARPWSARPVPEGELRLLRASPGLTGRVEVDFASVVHDGRSYPEHDPFIGRDVELRKLLKLPHPDADEAWQQFSWVWGDAGIGKSALLRQHACHVRDLAFADDDEPVWLLHAYCLNCVQPRDVEQLVCRKAAALYGWDPIPESFHALFKLLRHVPGIHVWVLDDLTYVRPEIGKEQDSLQVLRTIADTARAAGIVFQLTASARFAGPLGWVSWKLEPLSDPQAIELAESICRQAERGMTPQDSVDVHRLFARCGRSTVHFKRALLLAVAHQMSFSAMADELAAAGTLERQDEEEFSQRLIRVELEQLGRLSQRHGFDYRAFFDVYWPLILRAGHFTGPELLAWFPDEFHTAGSSISCQRAYANGLTQLVRLGFLATRRHEGGDVYYLPPNQRLVMRSIAAPAVSLPASIPFRAPKTRLSAALERVNKGQFSAVGEILELEHEYADHVSDPAAAEAVANAMMVRAELTRDLFENREAELEIYEQVVRQFGQGQLFPLAESPHHLLVDGQGLFPASQLAQPDTLVDQR